MNLAEKVEIERRHPVVVGNTREEVHQDELTVSFATITGLLVSCSLSFGTTFHDNNGWGTTTSNSYGR